jgi:hypothetical protein
VEAEYSLLLLLLLSCLGGLCTTKRLPSAFLNLDHDGCMKYELNYSVIFVLDFIITSTIFIFTVCHTQELGLALYVGANVLFQTYFLILNYECDYLCYFSFAKFHVSFDYFYDKNLYLYVFSHNEGGCKGLL